MRGNLLLMTNANNKGATVTNLPSILGLIDYEKQEVEGGMCPDCKEHATLRTCKACGASGWFISCTHYPEPYIGQWHGDAECLCEDCYCAAEEMGAA